MQYDGRVFIGNSIPSSQAQFFCSPKTAQKNKVYFLKKKVI